MIEQSDGVEVCERPGICTTLCYVVFTDGEEQDWRRNANPEHHIDARRLIADPVFVSFTGNESLMGTHCESKVNVLTPAEVTDLLLELKLLHKTRKPCDSKFVAYTDITATWSGSIS